MTERGVALWESCKIYQVCNSDGVKNQGSRNSPLEVVCTGLLGPDRVIARNFNRSTGFKSFSLKSHACKRSEGRKCPTHQDDFTKITQ